MELNMRCRSCDGQRLGLILSLGRMPLANSYLTSEQLSRPERLYPLDFVLCPDCTLVQITETVPPEILFREHLHFSSDSDARRTHAPTAADNVLAHVADLNGFVRGVALRLMDEGVVQFEVPYVKDLIDHVEFDTIHHEHLCYFSLTALDRLSHRHGLRLLDVERLPIHGGSLRVQFVRAASHQRTRESVPTLLREETAWGVGRQEFYDSFARRVEQLRARLCLLLTDLRRKGKRIAAYGAAAKGSTLLNFCSLSRNTIEFVVDRNPHKQGRYMPGVRIPILAPDQLLAQMPDYTLLLTWNFGDEILAQQAAYRQRGGKFITPVPEPTIA